MKLLWLHYALIMYQRKTDTTNIQSCAAAKACVGNLTSEETQMIKQWDNLAKTATTDLSRVLSMYEDRSASEVAVQLGIRTKFSCPLHPVSKIFNGDKARLHLFSLYCLLGYDLNKYCHRYKPIFNCQQEHIIAAPSGLYICNASAGTGKTACAIDRAYRFQSEGVIIVSYSNTAIKEVHNRLKTYPQHRGNIGNKQFQKTKHGSWYSIVVTTIDSLAWFICNDQNFNNTDRAHDQTIIDATNLVQRDTSFLASYKHIIIDEAQDIDELRGELMKSLYASGKFKSMVILGDPKQRINSGCGIWYTNLWSTGQYDSLRYHTIEPVLTSSTRVSNLSDQLMSLADSYTSTVTTNKISSTSTSNVKCLSIPTVTTNKISSTSTSNVKCLSIPTVTTNKISSTSTSNVKCLSIPTVTTNKISSTSTSNVKCLSIPTITTNKISYTSTSNVKCLSIPTSESKETITISGTKIGLTVSYRFKNNVLLLAHNDLSMKRPHLHVELTSESPLENMGNIKCYDVGDEFTDTGLHIFCTTFKEKYIDSNYCLPSDIAIVTPSVERDNMTSKKGQKLCAILKDIGINCYTRQEGVFIPNGVFLTTIPGIKGKQFKVVILYCMVEFPKFFPMIPSDIADSLIYVATTRATHDMIYLTNEGKFVPPRHVSMTYIELMDKIKYEASEDFNIHHRYYGVTDIVGSHGFATLVKTNAYTVTGDVIPSVCNNISTPEKSQVCIPSMPFTKCENSARIWGVMGGLIIETLLLGTHIDVFVQFRKGNIKMMTSHDYAKEVRLGNICNGIWIGKGEHAGSIVLQICKVNGIREEELKALCCILDTPIVSYTWKHWQLLTQIYDFINNGHMNARYDLQLVSTDTEFPYIDFMKVVDYIRTTFGHPVGVEGNVSFSLVNGVYDLLFEDAIVEIKNVREITSEHRYQVLSYNACLPVPRQKCYVYNIQNGTLELVTSSHQPMLWLYLLDVYVTIKNHADMVEIAKNRHVTKGGKLPPPPSPNQYVADTEFTIATQHIFDFAMVNLADPYHSIVQPLYVPLVTDTGRFPERIQAVKWIFEHTNIWKEYQLDQLFTDAVKCDQLSRCFQQLNGLRGSEVWYYKAAQDISIPLQYGMAGVDLGSTITTLARKYGSSYEPAMSVKLGEIYDIVVGPLVFKTYLHQHTALTDALILYEMFHLGHFENGGVVPPLLTVVPPLLTVVPPLLTVVPPLLTVVPPLLTVVPPLLTVVPLNTILFIDDLPVATVPPHTILVID
jgi:hypothetical protein